MSIKDRLYESIDKIALGIFPRAKLYRDLGVQYREHIAQELPKVFDSMKPEHASFLEKQLQTYGNAAYLEVIGQTLLIDMDICGIDVEKRQPKANQAALAAGLVWYSIKLIDNYLDERLNNLTKAEVTNLLINTSKSWRDGWNSRLDSEQFPGIDKIIDSTNALIHSGFAGDPDRYIGKINNLAWKEIIYLFPPAGKKMQAARASAAAHADLTVAIARQYIPEFGKEYRKFLMHQGITGKLLDDFKDFKIDRKQGHGYETQELPEIAAAGLVNFYKHFASLPDRQSKWRNANFIALALMFHVQELFGKKERS